jgi:putative addiction module CopG family antidote
MGITLNPQLERRIAEKVKSGEYASADEVIERSLDALEGRNGKTQPSGALAEPIWETIIRYGQQIPEEELAAIPADLSVNHDHYLYGSPKTKE